MLESDEVAAIEINLYRAPTDSRDKASHATAAQAQRLLAQKRFLDHRPCCLAINAIAGEHLLAVIKDEICILLHLQPLEMIATFQPHAGADDIQDVDDGEGPITLVRT